MIKVKGYEHYFGGKSGDGTYQTLINHIPPHDVFYSLFLGNCGVARHIRPARANCLCDLDKNVCIAWADALIGNCGYNIKVESAFDVLAGLAEYCDTVRIAEKCDTVQGNINQVASQQNAILDLKHFIFLDPPYRISSRSWKKPVYKFEMTDQDHVRLLEQVTDMPKGFNIMITHYPDEVYDMYLSAWVKKDYYSMTRNGLQLERMYMNYELTGELHDYRFLGDDFREREKFNRIKNNFLKKLNRLPESLRNSIVSSIAEKCGTSV